MKRMLYHLLVPAIIPAAFFVVILMPVGVLGCRTSGLVAALLALTGALAALGAVIQGVSAKLRGKPHAQRWLFSALILMIPVNANGGSGITLIRAVSSVNTSLNSCKE